jgi:hypothetical protein
LVAVATPAVFSAQQGKVVSSYGPTNQDITFDQIKADRMAVKGVRAKEHMDLLSSRYDLSKKGTAQSVMSGGKPIPVGPTAKLQGVAWEQLGKMTPEQIKDSANPGKTICRKKTSGYTRCINASIRFSANNPTFVVEPFLYCITA